MAYPNKAKKWLKPIAIIIGVLIALKFIVAKFKAHQAATAAHHD